MKLRSMEEKISYRLFLMGFLGLLFTAALCIFVFHKAFTAQAWTSLEREADLVSAGYDLVQDPQQLSSFVTNDLRITLISQDGSVLFESATDQPMENHLSRPEIRQAMTEGVGRDIRDSQTMGYETYYYAVLLPNGEILRKTRNSLYGVYNISEGPVPIGTGPSRLCVVICRKLHTVDFCAILVALPFPFWHQKGVRTDELNFSQLSRGCRSAGNGKLSVQVA